jgi:TldD protein
MDMDLSSLDLSYFPCKYVDVRQEVNHLSLISFIDYKLEDIVSEIKTAYFVRVFHNGYWFYASTPDLEKIEPTIQRLIKEANRLKPEASLFEPDTDRTDEELLLFSRDNPTLIKTDDKKLLLSNYQDVFRNEGRIVTLTSRYMDYYNIKTFKSSAGQYYSYDRSACGFRFNFTLREGDDIYSTRHQISGASYIDILSKEKGIEDYIKEATTFIHARPVKTGDYPVVLDEVVAGVFAHESFGHKSEADFMIGDEEAMKEWEIGKRIGSGILNIVDEGDLVGTSGYCPFDDEGTRGGKNYLISEGCLSGRLHSRETAGLFKETPTGNARALDAEFEPIIRMTNTFIEPGDMSFEEMLSSIREGVYIKNIKYGTGMSRFTIAPDMAYMIRDGRIAEPVRVSVISGNVFETLSLIDGLTDELKLEFTIFGGCGKNEQYPLPVGLGGPKVRVSSMQVS